MPITLIRQPDAFMFAGNPIPVRFNCTDYLTQTGQKAKNRLRFIFSLTSTAITLKYSRNTIVMTASATPNQTGTQFPSGNGSEAHVVQALPYFQANYFLNRDFNIYKMEGNASIIFEAKENGPGFNMIPGSYGNHEIILSTSGQVETIKPNYSVYFELYLQNTSHTGFDLIYSNNLQLIYGQSGKAEIYLEELLETELLKDIYKDGPEMPLMSQLTPEECKKSCRKFYFKYAESFGDTPAVKAITRSATYTVLQGALSYVGVAIMNQLTLLAPDALDASKDRFLWQGPLQQPTRFDQPQFYYFYNSRSAKPGAKHKVKFYFMDATTSTKTISIFDLKEKEKLAFNLRFDVLHYNHIAPDATLTGKKVLKYETWLESFTGNKLCETLTFIIDRTYQEQVRYFMYLNSWGAVDHLMATGKGKAAFDIEQNETNRLNQDYNQTRKGEALVFDVNLQNKFTVATGWFKRKADFVRRREFFASPLKYRYVNGYLLPIKITSKSVEELQDGSGLDAHVLEYQYLFKEHAYTDGDGDEPIANNFDL